MKADLIAYCQRRIFYCLLFYFSLLFLRTDGPRGMFGFTAEAQHFCPDALKEVTQVAVGVTKGMSPALSAIAKIHLKRCLAF